MPSQKVAVNYFRSTEFLNTVQVVGTTSIPYIVLIAKAGFSVEAVLTLIFAGLVGGVVKAKKDLELSPNLYTPIGVAGTDPNQAIAYVAHNIAIEKATEQVIPVAAQNRINEVANNIADDIINTTQILPDFLKPSAKKIGRDFLRGLFK
jgi:hypothetical protein